MACKIRKTNLLILKYQFCKGKCENVQTKSENKYEAGSTKYEVLRCNKFMNGKQPLEPQYSISAGPTLRIEY
jgi:hypothetical protein